MGFYNPQKHTIITIGRDIMEEYIVPVTILFVILVSIQYSINKVIVLLKEIKEILLKKNLKD